MIEWLFSNAVALLAIAISGLAALFTYLQTRKSNKLQERIVNIEEAREKERDEKEKSAAINSYIEFEDTGISKIPHHVVVVNEGSVSAKNLRVYFNGQAPSKADFIYLVDEKDTLKVLPTGDRYRYTFSQNQKEQEPLNVKVIFDDPLQKNKIYEQDLRL